MYVFYVSCKKLEESLNFHEQVRIHHCPYTLQILVCVIACRLIACRRNGTKPFSDTVTLKTQAFIDFAVLIMMADDVQDNDTHLPHTGSELELIRHLM